MAAMDQEERLWRGEEVKAEILRLAVPRVVYTNQRKMYWGLCRRSLSECWQ